MEPSQIDLPKLLEVATEAANSAAQLLASRFGTDMDVRLKPGGAHDLVTEMDIASEKLIQHVIRGHLPDAKFLGEETGGDRDLTELTWVVDPIDGTVNYAHGIPIWCVSIAAVANHCPLVGVIANPSVGELFTATSGAGAFLNGKRLRVTETPGLVGSVLVTGFPYNVAENPFGCIDSFAAFVRRGIPVRRLGSAALDLAYVAAGRFDGFWEVKLNEWDIAAGALMVHEAGGAVRSYGPNNAQGLLTTDRLLATNGVIEREMLEVLQQ
ncbi:MAG: inositol monophosphatase [Chlorobi bacterium]|nr:inositol monophosphatase [Chlorobiota bacterium]MBX7216418.1 inositol monophosphatase [Candidatus Kapabacteria bacterium]